MSSVLVGSATSKEVSERVQQLRRRYQGNPLVKRIEHRIEPDWSGDPSVYIDIVLAQPETTAQEVIELAKSLRYDLLHHIRTDEIGLHSYLHFVS